MADFAGFNIETPQEVLARVQQANGSLQQQAFRTGDVAAINRTNVLVAMNGFFGQLEAQGAQEKQQQLTRRMANAIAELPPEASPQERQRARVQAVADFADATGDTDLGLQASEQLLQMEEAAFERSRLTESDVRARELHTARIAQLTSARERDALHVAREEALGNHQVVLSGTFKNPVSQTFNLDDPTQVEARDRLLASDPNAIPMDPKQAAQFRFGARNGLVGKNEARKFRELTSGQVESLRLTERYLSLLEDNPAAFATGTRLSAAADRFLRNAQSATDAVTGALDVEDFEFSDQLLTRQLDEAGITNTRQRGLAANLAYAMMKNRDGGRLSETDINFALDMIGGQGGNPNPRAVAAALEDNIVSGARNHLQTLVRSGDEQFGADIAALEGSLQSIDRIVQGLQAQSPAARTPSLDGASVNQRQVGNITVGRQ